MGMMDEAWKESVRNTKHEPIKIKMSNKRYIVCTDCKGNGYKFVGGHTETCQTCGGSGNLNLVNVQETHSVEQRQEDVTSVQNWFAKNPQSQGFRS
jgi:DnaJ-class molecular chaperone